MIPTRVVANREFLDTVRRLGLFRFALGNRKRFRMTVDRRTRGQNDSCIGSPCAIKENDCRPNGDLVAPYRFLDRPTNAHEPRMVVNKIDVVGRPLGLCFVVDVAAVWDLLSRKRGNSVCQVATVKLTIHPHSFWAVR